MYACIYTHACFDINLNFKATNVMVHFLHQGGAHCFFKSQNLAIPWGFLVHRKPHVLCACGVLLPLCWGHDWPPALPFHVTCGCARRLLSGLFPQAPVGYSIVPRAPRKAASVWRALCDERHPRCLKLIAAEVLPLRNLNPSQDSLWWREWERRRGKP